MLTLILTLTVNIPPAPSQGGDPADRFIGRWSQGAADVEGYDTIRPIEPSCAVDEAVTIERIGPAQLRRISPGGVSEVFVRGEGDAYVWSMREGDEGYQVRFGADGSFKMAGGIGPDPDWSRAWQHWPCPT